MKGCIPISTSRAKADKTAKKVNILFISVHYKKETPEWARQAPPRRVQDF
jgi:hypothetical protein